MRALSALLYAATLMTNFTTVCVRRCDVALLLLLLLTIALTTISVLANHFADMICLHLAADSGV